MYGRADQTKYQTGLKTCRNFRVLKHGGVANRSGYQYINEVKDSSAETYLMKWVFNAEQTYVIEVGNLYMRFFRNGARITVSGVAAYVGATPYVVGDLVESGGVNYYCVADTTGNAPPNATYWYALDGSIFEIPTPYLTADLAKITANKVQSGDVVTIVHPDYPTRELTRTGHTTWTLTLKAFAPSVAGPTNCAGTAGGAGALVYRYRVTTVKEETFEESLPGLGATQVISNITQANPAVLTYVGADNFENGDEIYIDGVAGMTEVNGETFKVANVNTGANTFELQTLSSENVNSTGYTAYGSVGTIAAKQIRISAAAAPTAAAPHVLTWTHADEWGEYDIYRETSPGSGTYAFMAVANGSTYSDTGGTTPDTAVTPPMSRNPFNEVDSYPSVASYYQQRLVLANVNANIEKVWTSRTGQFDNFTVSSPLQDDDAVTFSIAGKQVNAIRAMVEIGDFVILTSGGEWVVLGDADGVLRANQPPNLKQIGEYGSAEVAPVIIGNSLLHVQARGTIIRDLRNEVQAGGQSSYNGRDLTVFAGHLFKKKTIDRFDFAQIPDSVAWAKRSDGVLLGLTYLRDHEVWGWHWHDTEGKFEDVCVVPEGDEDVNYVIVRRYVDGSYRRYIERGHETGFTDIAVDAIFMDSYLSYDGRNTGATELTLSAAADWTVDDEITITATAGTPFVAGDVGNWFVLNLVDDDPDSETFEEIISTVTIDVTAFDSTTVVRGTPSATVPDGLQGVATTNWSRAVDEIAGADHLEGKDVACFADGHVVASPNNDRYTVLTVAGGIATLSRPYSVIHVGLPYLADFRTLDLDVQGEQIRSKAKNVTHISLLVEETRGIFAGPDFDDLQEFQPTPVATYSEPWPLENGLVEMNIASTWEGTGSFCVRQKDPLPITILSAIPSTAIGG